MASSITSYPYISAQRFAPAGRPQDNAILAKVAAESRLRLADKLSVNPALVRVLGYERKTFTDTSLGFPEKDVCYPCVMVEGYSIKLQCGTIRYFYNASEAAPDDGRFGIAVPATYYRPDEKGIFWPDDITAR
ncbi:MAG: hypothetical protein HYU64_04725 [Armatimonadetes bacterium]|nr:hypothetical protein [Armatimonadota bacterium]